MPVKLVASLPKHGRHKTGTGNRVSTLEWTHFFPPISQPTCPRQNLAPDSKIENALLHPENQSRQILPEMSQDYGATECVVSAGPGVQISCVATQDGLIAIQTTNGLINILLRHAPTHQTETFSHRTLRALSRPRVTDDDGTIFCFICIDGTMENADTWGDHAVNEETESRSGEPEKKEECSRVQTPLEEEDSDGATEDIPSDNIEEWEHIMGDDTDESEDIVINEDDMEAVISRAVSEEEEEETDELVEEIAGQDAIDGENDKSENAAGTKRGSLNLVREVEVKDRCHKIKMKIGKNWPKASKQLKKMLPKWTAEPYTFFGRKDFDSAEQWSYLSMLDAEDSGPSYRSPFFKAFLASRLIQRMEDTKNSELACRGQMLAELEPEFKTLLRREKLPKYKQFQRCINQGKFFLFILTKDPGLMLTVAQFLAQKEYALHIILQVIY